MKRPLSEISRNPVSLIGLALVVASITVFAVLVALGLFFHEGGPYLGILTFLIVPAVLLLGVILVPIGLRWQRKKDLKAAAARGETVPAFPVIDFNRPRTRSVFLSFVGLSLLITGILTVGMVKGIHVMDSTAFCGTACHTPMQPEYTSYQRFAHSRVACADCHIGPGADWFVKSKLSGAWQLVAVTFDLFPRPIPTPIHNLRPARDTCEQCHWPAKFVGDKLLVRTSFDADEQNTAKQTVLLMKVGGQQGQHASGVHWHVDPANRIRYRSDASREKIYEVELTRGDKAPEVFRRDGEKPADLAPEWRTMDCVDCHNRPAHTFRLPEREVDEAMAAGRIDPKLPFIKREAMTAMKKEYASQAAAAEAIPAAVSGFYTKQFPEVAGKQSAAVKAAGTELARLYNANVFPTMKVTWGTYPNHLGHNDFPGCFRCHDDELAASKERTISGDCELCHSTLADGEVKPEILKQLYP
jgi:hypothetical protein